MDKHIKKIIKESYEKNARLRDRNEIIPWKINEMNKYISYLKKIDKVSMLDIGSGTGQYAKYFNNKDIEVICVDISHEMVKACKEKGLDAQVMDFYFLDFGEKQFDAIWAMNSLLHVPKDSINIILKNIYNVLKQEGLLYVGVYGGRNFEGIWEDDRYIPKRFFSFYDDDKVKSIFNQYFDILDFEVIPQENSELHYQSIIMRKRSNKFRGSK